MKRADFLSFEATRTVSFTPDNIYVWTYVTTYHVRRLMLLYIVHKM